jgi:D-arginine dehydrogenase
LDRLQHVSASTVVIAAGAWSEQLGVSLSAELIQLKPLRRTAVLVDAPPGVDTGRWPAVFGVDDSYYFKPDAGRLLLSPADEAHCELGDVQLEEVDVAIAVDRVQAVADLPVRRVNHAWAGLRTFVSDGPPVVGFDPAVEGLFWLAGQGGYGIQTAPALSSLSRPPSSG